jgi:hypothetical protein
MGVTHVSAAHQQPLRDLSFFLTGGDPIVRYLDNGTGESSTMMRNPRPTPAPAESRSSRRAACLPLRTVRAQNLRTEMQNNTKLAIAD